MMMILVRVLQTNVSAISRMMAIWIMLSTMLVADEKAAEVAPVRHYQGSSLQAADAAVTGWQDKVVSDPLLAERSVLNRIVGQPRRRVARIGDAQRSFVRFDGQAGIWQAANEWGSFSEQRTLIFTVRLAERADGFLFDGSTNSGLTRAQIRDGYWQVGVQPPPIGNAANADSKTHAANYGVWQTHVFVFEKRGNQTDIRHAVASNNRVHWKTVSANANQPLSGFIVGMNAATKFGLKADVAEILVFDRALSESVLDERLLKLQAQWSAASDLPETEQPREPGIHDPEIFHQVIRRNGDDGVKSYRIPGLATSIKGTLLAVFDIRHDGGADLPANIDVGLMRSLDNGVSWTPMTKILDFDRNESNSRGNGVGDPSILVDRETGTIFVAALWSKGNRGWHGSGPGLTPNETGQFVITTSQDDGVTWSAPINITQQVKQPEWRLCFQGPGAGIQTRSGRLIFPAQFKDAAGVAHSCFIMSNDHGKQWAISAPAMPDKPPTSEAQIAELDDGSLLLSMRDESRRGQRAWAHWEWQSNDRASNAGQWTSTWSTVPDPTCMASLLKVPQGPLLFSNPNSPNRRVALTIRSSTDAGKSWSAGRLLDPRGCMYSCLTLTKDGQVAVLYEVDGTLTFARFTLDWVLRKPSL